MGTWCWHSKPCSCRAPQTHTLGSASRSLCRGSEMNLGFLHSYHAERGLRAAVRLIQNTCYSPGLFSTLYKQLETLVIYTVVTNQGIWDASYYHNITITETARRLIPLPLQLLYAALPMHYEPFLQIFEVSSSFTCERVPGYRMVERKDHSDNHLGHRSQSRSEARVIQCKWVSYTRATGSRGKNQWCKSFAQHLGFNKSVNAVHIVKGWDFLATHTQ